MFRYREGEARAGGEQVARDEQGVLHGHYARSCPSRYPDPARTLRSYRARFYITTGEREKREPLGERVTTLYVYIYNRTQPLRIRASVLVVDFLLPRCFFHRNDDRTLRSKLGSFSIDYISCAFSIYYRFFLLVNDANTNVSAQLQIFSPLYIVGLKRTFFFQKQALAKRSERTYRWLSC